MIDMLKRREIQVLQRAGHSQIEIATLAGVSRRSVQRVERESVVSHIDAAREREARGLADPAKAELFRGVRRRGVGARPRSALGGSAAACEAERLYRRKDGALRSD
jgi:predicted transcriptional regulator